MKALFIAVLTGHGLLLPLGTLILAGLFVFVVASRLAHHADAIADATGMGRVWIGSLLLAASTSMPEIVTDVSAAAFGLPNIGVGDLMGSTLANMLLLALLDIAFGRRQLLQHAAIDHALVGVLAIVLTAFAGMSIAGGGWGTLGFVGADTLLIGVAYVFGMRIVFDLTTYASNGDAIESNQPSTESEHAAARRLAKRSQLIRSASSFAIASIALLFVVPLLIFSAEAVAIEGGVSDSFVGTFLVGLTTSFPEVAAGIAAVRIGAIDLAVGNVFGSNAFNMIVLLMMDVAYRGKPLLSAVSQSHTVTAYSAIAAISLGVMALLARAHQRAWVARGFSASIVSVYVLSLYLLSRLT